jgi:hypothetical protein
MQTIQDEILPRPVISTQFDSSLGNHPFPEDEQPVHPNPDVLALGIVLLELFFGKPIDPIPIPLQERCVAVGEGAKRLPTICH